MPDYKKEDLWELEKKLPAEIQEVIFSEETATKIKDACDRNGVKEEDISTVAKYVGHVLLGVLPPDELEATLEQSIEADKKSIRQLVWEIQRFVFFPIKESLEILYSIEITPSLKPQESGSAGTSQPKGKIRQKKTLRKDIYRENIE